MNKKVIVGVIGIIVIAGGAWFVVSKSIKKENPSEEKETNQIRVKEIEQVEVMTGFTEDVKQVVGNLETQFSQKAATKEEAIAKIRSIKAEMTNLRDLSMRATIPADVKVVSEELKQIAQTYLTVLDSFEISIQSDAMTPAALNELFAQNPISMEQVEAQLKSRGIKP